MGAAMARRGPVVFIARPARAGAVWGHRPGSRALAAGVTWRCRTASAPWALRSGHTSVIDAAGAIYVIGGYGGGTDFNDVWASTDGGARAGLGRRGGRGYCWVLRGDSVVPLGTTGVLGVLGGTQGIIRSTTGYYRSTQEQYGVLRGYYMGTMGLLWGYYRRTRGVLEGYHGDNGVL